MCPVSVGVVFTVLPSVALHVEVKKKGEFSSHLSPRMQAAETTVTIMIQNVTDLCIILLPKH